MREWISPSCSRGSRISSGKILEKWTQMVHSESIFGRLQDEFYPIVQEGRFLSSRSKGGGVRVSPRKFLKNGCKWGYMSPFCRLLVNIFSNFATTPRIYVMREYYFSPFNTYTVENFLLLQKKGGGGEVFPGWFLLWKNGCK